ncbi:MAG: hypothetical protein Q6361_01160, partial [Candidatus Hermodarchaeota archaeon]|nr:hypothetical protein [Candidatus Hermodarchaeota archaeon]
LGTGSVALRIVGFFGPSSGGDGQRLVQDTWSYVGQLFLNFTNSYPRRIVMLASLSSLHVNSHVIDAIESLEGVSQVDTVSTQLVQHQAETTFYSLGEPLIQLSLIFSYILVSLGLGIIMYLTLHERRRTTALMTIRGTSFHQLLRILLSEWITLIAFATLLGLTVGLIQTHGIILLTQQSIVHQSLVTKRFLPLPSLLPLSLQISTYICVLFLATLIPVTLHAYRHQYDLSAIQYSIYYFLPTLHSPRLFMRSVFTNMRL